MLIAPHPVTRLRAHLLAGILAGLLAACERAPETPARQSAGDPSPVLATIDGHAIHRAQLDAMLEDMFGVYRARRMDAAGRRKALDSLLSAHALSQKALRELAPDKVRRIEEKTRRYRQNLLINAYLQTRLDKRAVSEAGIRQYYQDHPDKFGRQTVKQYRLLSLKSVLPEEDRARFLETVSRNKSGGDMQALRRELEAQGFEVELQTGALDKAADESAAMPPRLQAFIAAQKQGAVSDIAFVENRPYVVQITAETTRPPRPLAEVREDIRKTLLFGELRRALARESAAAMAQAKIEYKDKDKDK